MMTPNNNELMLYVHAKAFACVISLAATTEKKGKSHQVKALLASHFWRFITEFFSVYDE
ncbi:MAG: hypothetical protein ACTH8P_05390 [Ewingella sp.]|uniref:hypothetical protein n=1 Tax=Ewingella TaxID=41201 RepID=UPI0018491B76|nr:hypothetical protein [Pseudomonas reactans]